jgi:hypothetical protein
LSLGGGKLSSIKSLRTCSASRSASLAGLRQGDDLIDDDFGHRVCVTSNAGPHGAAQYGEEGPSGSAIAVADPKPPQAAMVKSHGGERCETSSNISAGKIERRAQANAEASKSD